MSSTATSDSVSIVSIEGEKDRGRREKAAMTSSTTDGDNGNRLSIYAVLRFNSRIYPDFYTPLDIFIKGCILSMRDLGKDRETKLIIGRGKPR